MFGNISNPLEPTTERGKELKRKLWIYLIVYVAVTLIKVLMLNGQGFMDIFNALFLYCGINAIDPCMLSFFVFMSMFSLFQIVVVLGTLIQHGNSLFKEGMGLISFIMIVSLGVYIYGFWLVYEAYKEFKADRKENNLGNGGGLGMGMDPGALLGGQDGGNGGGNVNTGGNSGGGGGGSSGFRAFQGQGVAIG